MNIPSAPVLLVAPLAALPSDRSSLVLIPVMGSMRRPIVEFAAEVESGPGWDDSAGHFCVDCAKKGFPCADKADAVFAWRPGDPVYSGSRP